MSDDLVTTDPPPRRSKYGAKRTEYSGRMYASKKEAARAAELDLLIKVGEVESWTAQPRFECWVGPHARDLPAVKICTYVADFEVHWTDGRTTFEDVKGMKTPIYRLKKKLVETLYVIAIEEK